MSQKSLKEAYNRLLEIAQESNANFTVEDSTMETQSNTMRADALVAGVFGRGKSTLLNALIKRDILPTETSPTDTATIFIESANQDTLTVSHADGETKVDRITDDYFKNNTDNLKNINNISLKLSAKHLPDGFRLLEVAGLGQINPKHRDSLDTILPMVPNLIFVVDIILDPSESELAFLSELPDTVKEIIFVANKADVQGTSGAEFEKWREFIQELNVDVPVQMFRISAKEILSGSESYEWENLVAAIAKLPRSSLVTQEETLSRESVIKLANSIRASLIAETAPSVESNKGKKQQRLSRTHNLILQVVEDQATDIKQTIKESLEATVYRIESSLSQNPRQTDIVQQLQDWIDQEIDRTQTRLERHTKSIMDDVEHATGKREDIRVKMFPVSIQSVKAVDEASQSPEYQGGRDLAFRSLTSGAATTAIGLFIIGMTPVGWMVSISVGGAAAVMVYLRGQNSQSRPSNKIGGKSNFPDLSTVLLPKFHESVDHNQNELTDFVNRAFSDEEDDTKSDKSTAKSNPHVAEIDQILASL